MIVYDVLSRPRTVRVEHPSLCIIIIIIIVVISIAPYLTDKGEHTTFYKILILLM